MRATQLATMLCGSLYLLVMGPHGIRVCKISCILKIRTAGRASRARVACVALAGGVMPRPCPLSPVAGAPRGDL